MARLVDWPGEEDVGLAGSAGRVLLVATVIVVVAVAGALTATTPETARLLDNVYRTTSYLAAATLAWLGTRRAPTAERVAKRWFALALSAYSVGQVLWDVQVAVGCIRS
jgi:hypothetical protein